MGINRPYARIAEDTARLCDAKCFSKDGFENRSLLAMRENILKKSDLLRFLTARSSSSLVPDGRTTSLPPSNPADSSESQRIIVFRGIREGVGTTTLAASVSWFWSRYRPPVLAIDASPSPLGIGAQFGLPDAGSGWNNDDLAEQSLPLWEHDSDLLFLPKSEEGFLNNPDALSDSSRISSLCALLERTALSNIVVDIGTEKDSPWLKRACCIVTVLSADINAYARLSRLDATPNECFVVNGHHLGHDSDNDLCALLLTHPALGDKLFPKPIPFDELLRQALMLGRPCAEAFPYSVSVEAHAGFAAWLRLMASRGSER